ncbi:MAG: hypothetical protein LQ340_005952, partial [Diploschistes diacapsis]
MNDRYFSGLRFLGTTANNGGPYPALLDGPRGGKVEGVAFEVRSAEQVKLLQDYETKRYRKAGCGIWLMEDGKKVLG